MKVFSADFVGNVRRTASVASFRFKPVEPFTFAAGQFLQVMFDPQNPADKELNKYLSFSSAPGKEYIEVTKRLSESQFSARLKALKSGDEVVVKAPLGKCVLGPGQERIAFVVGGIGITPVISMLEDVYARKLNVDAALFYSNRSEADIAFKPELDHWRASHRLRVFYYLTDCPPRGKGCIFGRINSQALKENLDDWPERQVFIFGPPKMVEVMKAACLEAGCLPEKIETESFLGY